MFIFDYNIIIHYKLDFVNTNFEIFLFFSKINLIKIRTMQCAK